MFRGKEWPQKWLEQTNVGILERFLTTAIAGKDEEKGFCGNNNRLFCRVEILQLKPADCRALFIERRLHKQIYVT